MKAVDMGAEEVDPGDGHKPSDEVPSHDKPVESAQSAPDNPAVPSPTTTTLPATHSATSSPTTTHPMAEGPGFTGIAQPTYGDSSHDCATYGNCSQRTSGIQLHVHRCS